MRRSLHSFTSVVYCRTVSNIVQEATAKNILGFDLALADPMCILHVSSNTQNYGNDKIPLQKLAIFNTQLFYT